MRKAHRPMGRFFCLLMVMAAAWLPAAVRTLAAQQTTGPAMTQVVDTVYRADGTTAKGTVLISWPGFTTADGAAVAAGSLNVRLGSDGTFAANLAPNTGAQPAGVYYRVVYQLAGQEPSTEYWVVPATGSISIGSVRAKLMPPTIAAQVLTRDVADTNYVHVAGDQTVSGVKTFTTSPAVPAPQNAGDAANKAYVDSNGGGNLASPAAIGSVTPNTGTFTTLSAQVEGKRYKVEGFPSSCVVNSVTYTTQFDCAFQTAYHAAQTTSTNQTLELGNAIYLTNVGMQQPGEYVVNIIGAGESDTTEETGGGSSVIRLNSTITTAILNLSVINLPAPHRRSVTYRDFLIDANGKAPVCMDIASTRKSYFERIACQNATGSNYWVRFGVPTSDVSGSNYDIVVNSINIVGPYSQNLARVTANVVGGAIGTTGYTVSSGGSGYVNGPSIPVFLTGYGAGANPCTTMPTGLHATIVSGVVTAVSSSTGASGCSGNVYVTVPDLPAAAYGFYNGFTSDSSFTDIVVEGVGNVAAIYDIGSSSNLWIHAHPWGNQPVALENHGGGNFYQFQCDGPIHYCVDFEVKPPGSVGGTESVHMSGTVYVPSLAPGGTSMYYLGSASLQEIEIRDDYAPGTLAPDFHRFVSYAIGPVNESVTNFFNYFPAAFQSTGFQSYNAPSVDKYDYHGYYDQYFLSPLKSSVTFNGIAFHYAPIGVANGKSLTGYSDNFLTTTYNLDAATGSLYSPQFYATSLSTAGFGQASLNAGDATHSGFVKWFTPTGTALGYMGYDALNRITVQMLGGYPFDLEGGALQVGGVTVVDPSRNATVNNLTVHGTCTGCGGGGPGREYFVSTYGSIQAAIDAAYNNGSVQGEGLVIDDRTAPYSGPGFIVRDSVTVKLAATTYTITGTVSNNNGVANVTAGIISMPGSHIVGAGTSANHGTNVNAGAGLNADVIATSTVGTGVGANAQWWHWGLIENLHMNGNKASQTAGSCINVENMGETAVLRALEVGNCYADDIRLEGNFATQSEISNITVNSAGRFGVDLDNFQGVGVLRGLSGDSNATSIIRFNGSQSATLTVLGLKSEEEISGHDPLITIDMPADGSQPAFYLVGGYTYARPGVHDVIKIINGKTGSAPFVQVSNFYVDANFVNAVNDTVNSRTFAASNMNKVPFSYLPTGSYQSGQAFTFAPGTFIQGGSSALTEIFGSSTDGSSMIAAQGNGDGTSYFTGGLKIGIPNRVQFGQPPEMMARMGSRFLGAGNGYDTNTWVFVPIWKSGDSSNRWIGDPNQRWPKVYAADMNATTATVGTLNVTSCTGCGGAGTWGSIGGTLSDQTDLQSALNGKQNALGYTPPHSVAIVGPTSAVTGTGAMTALYSVTIPAGTFTVGTGVRCVARSRHTTGSGSVSMGWKLGGTTYTYPTAYTTGTTGGDASIEIFTFSSLTAETVNIPWASFGGTTESPYTGLAWSENVSSASTLQFLFNVGSSDKLTGDGLYCMTMQ